MIRYKPHPLQCSGRLPAEKNPDAGRDLILALLLGQRLLVILAAGQLAVRRLAHTQKTGLLREVSFASTMATNIHRANLSSPAYIKLKWPGKFIATTQ